MTTRASFLSLPFLAFLTFVLIASALATGIATPPAWAYVPNANQILPPLPGATDDFWDYNTWNPGNPAFPAVGGSYNDPRFSTPASGAVGTTTITRLSNVYVNPPQCTGEIWGKNGYQNANGTMAFSGVFPGAAGCEGAWQIIDTHTGNVLYPYPLPAVDTYSINDMMSFDPFNPNVYWVGQGTKLRRVTLSGTAPCGPTPIVCDEFDFGPFTGGVQLPVLGAGHLNWLAAIPATDGLARYFLALYPDWSIHILDRQTGTVINGPITCSYPPFDPTSPDPLISDPTRCVTGGYFTITPSGNHIVAYGTSLGDIALVYTVTLNQSCNPNCGSIASTHYTTWDLCGDHAAFASATDGNDYMVVFNCYDAIEVRVRNIALVSGGLSEEKTNSRLIFTMSGTDEVHFTCSVTQHQNWCIVDTEGDDDQYNSVPTASTWRVYEQEIIAFNILGQGTDPIRRLAHHRTRNPNGADYYKQPKVSISWDGSSLIWFSDYNVQTSGYADLYGMTPPLP